MLSRPTQTCCFKMASCVWSRAKTRRAAIRRLMFCFDPWLVSRKTKPSESILRTASDGAAGMKAIKEEGGVTSSRTEDSAKHFGMPQKLIATGAIDFVLSPEQIAKRLTRIGRHPHGELTKIEQPVRAKLLHEREEPLDQLFRLLTERYGVDFSNYKPSTISRRLQRRMAVRKIGSLKDYLAYVSKQPDELRELYQGMFVGITGFFREPKSWRDEKTGVSANPEGTVCGFTPSGFGSRAVRLVRRCIR